MLEPTTLGTWLRRERERRGVSLTKISEDTKVSVSLLEGLESDDLSRWPGGIFRRSFARSYAAAIGLDPELVVKRIEEEHPSDDEVPAPARLAAAAPPTAAVPGARTPDDSSVAAVPPRPARRARIEAALLELLVAGALGFGFAAAGSRLLWPVLAIAAYHALGLLLTGTTPMMALLGHGSHQRPAPAAIEAPRDQDKVPEPDVRVAAPAPRRAEAEARPRRPQRSRRGGRPDQAAARR